MGCDSVEAWREGLFTRRENRYKPTVGFYHKRERKTMRKRRFGFIFLVLAALFPCGCTNPNTPAGEEGYVYEDPRIWGTGGFQGVMTGPANNWGSTNGIPLVRTVAP